MARYVPANIEGLQSAYGWNPFYSPFSPHADLMKGLATVLAQNKQRKLAEEEALWNRYVQGSQLKRAEQQDLWKRYVDTSQLGREEEESKARAEYWRQLGEAATKSAETKAASGGASPRPPATPEWKDPAAQYLAMLEQYRKDTDSASKAIQTAKQKAQEKLSAWEPSLKTAKEQNKSKRYIDNIQTIVDNAQRELKDAEAKEKTLADISKRIAGVTVKLKRGQPVPADVEGEITELLKAPLISLLLEGAAPEQAQTAAPAIPQAQPTAPQAQAAPPVAATPKVGDTVEVGGKVFRWNGQSWVLVK